MILRRVIAHFRKQEWTAIFLDFIIVVLGVFIGIQVANWNTARAERAEERQLVTRLHAEARTLLEIQRSEYDRQLPRVEAMVKIYPLLFDQTPTRSLSEFECRLIAVSHWLPAPTDEMPVLEEAISTGRFDLISNETIEASLRRFALVRNRSRRQYDESVNELFRLPGRHPAAVRYVRVPDDGGELILGEMRDGAQLARRAGEGYRWSNECDFETMRSDSAFLAEYVDNASRLNSFIERYEELIAVLADLENALAAELGVPGATEAAGEAP
jgi:hypothetical protein